PQRRRQEGHVRRARRDDARGSVRRFPERDRHAGPDDRARPRLPQDHRDIQGEDVVRPRVRIRRAPDAGEGMTSRRLASLALLAGACGTQAATGYPLYPKLGDGPGADKVSTLYGPIQTVDGQDVSSKGRTFELLPGCHVVTLQRNIGEGSATGAWAANFPRLTFAFERNRDH